MKLADVLDGLFVETPAWFIRPELPAAESLESLEHCPGYSQTE